MLGRKPQVGKAGRGLIEAFWRFGDATSRVYARRYDVKRITRVRNSKLTAKAVPSRDILRIKRDQQHRNQNRPEEKCALRLDRSKNHCCIASFLHHSNSYPHRQPSKPHPSPFSQIHFWSQSSPLYLCKLWLRFRLSHRDRVRSNSRIRERPIGSTRCLHGPVNHWC